MIEYMGNEWFQRRSRKPQSMNNKYTLFLQFSTVPHLLKKANAILALAVAHPEEADILPACAAVILAAALDQGTTDVLSGAASKYAIENDVHASVTSYEALLNETLRRRMQHTPEVLTNGRFRLNPHSPYTQALYELITLRNRLMHISDEPQVLTETSERVQIKNDMLTITVPIPRSLWSTVTIEQVRDYQRAIEIYFSEILFPESGDIQSGQIVSRVA